MAAAPHFPSLRLTYFDGPGRADPIRLALTVGGVPFEDERISVAEWSRLRAAAETGPGERDLPLLQLPLLTVHTTVYPQSMAQLRFAGRLAALYPTDPLVQLAVDEVVETLQEVLNRAPQASAPARKQALREEYEATVMARAFAFVDGRIAARGNGGFAGGDELSIADLCLVTLVSLIEHGNFEYVNARFCDKYPSVTALIRRLRVHPKLAALLPPPPERSPAPPAVSPAAVGGEAEPAVAAAAAAAASEAKETEKAALPPERVRTWADDALLGKACPAFDTLDFVSGTAPPTDPRPVSVVVLWAMYCHSEFGLLVDLSELAATTPEVAFVGVSLDKCRSDVEAFLKRRGGSFPESKVAKLTVDFALAHDAGRHFREELDAHTRLAKVGPSLALLVDRAGTIVWKECFSLVHPLEKGQFTEQLRRLSAGEPLLSNGLNPTAVEDDDDDFQSDNDTDVSSEDSDGLLL